MLLFFLLYYNRNKWWAAAIFLGLMMLTHKASWFFALPLVAFAFVKNRASCWPLVLASMPLGALMVTGAFHHGDMLWFMRWSTENLLVSRSALPVFDGILGSILSGRLPAVLKGLISLSILAIALALLAPIYRRRFWIGVAILCGIIAMAILINQYEIWALVRFSKVILIPATVVLLQPRNGDLGPALNLSRVQLGVLLATGVATNAAFGYYRARIWSRPENPAAVHVPTSHLGKDRGWAELAETYVSVPRPQADSGGGVRSLTGAARFSAD
jgi:hypothetical protein